VLAALVYQVGIVFSTVKSDKWLATISGGKVDSK
jgi:hypothetical protein